MGFLVGTLASDMGYQVLDLQKDALAVMKDAADRLEKTGDPRVTAALTRWFGDNSAPFATEMRKNIRKMRSVLNASQIECTTSTGPYGRGDPTENASATHFPGGVFGGGTGDRVQRMTSNLTSINISPNFSKLARTSNGLASAWLGQDRLATILHELSHYVHGTSDELLDSGITAYEAQNARLLANQSPAKAKRNAENWGFFIEDLGN